MENTRNDFEILGGGAMFSMGLFVGLDTVFSLATQGVAPGNPLVNILIGGCTMYLGKVFIEAGVASGEVSNPNDPGI